MINTIIGIRWGTKFRKEITLTLPILIEESDRYGLGV